MSDTSIQDGAAAGRPKASRARIVDSPGAPTVYAEGSIGFIASHGNVHVTFATLRADHSQPGTQVEQVVNLRLIMPVAAAKNLAETLQGYLRANEAAISSQGMPMQ